MKPPQEQAEYLADYCTLQLSISGHTFPGHVCRSKETITKSIPLTELIAVAQTAATSPCRHHTTIDSKTCPTCLAFQALRATGKVEL